MSSMKKKLIREEGHFELEGAKVRFCLIFSSQRKRSITLKIKDEGVAVYAPLHTPKAHVQEFLHKQRAWIQRHLGEARRKKEDEPYYSQQEIARYRVQALEKVSERMQIWQLLLGVKAGRLKVTNAAKRWGSCSPDNNICVTWRIMLLPLELLDYIVVHELCHIVHKNHSARFWGLMGSVMPDYRERDGRLNRWKIEE
jgi:predicted metal-dependent hydrolase